MAQPYRAETTSPETTVKRAPMAFPFGLRNTAQDVRHLITPLMAPKPAKTELVGMTDYLFESIHDLLTGTTKNLSDTGSSEASHHSSCECFMAGSPNGHLGNNDREVTPPASLGDGAEEGSDAPLAL